MAHVESQTLMSTGGKNLAEPSNAAAEKCVFGKPRAAPPLSPSRSWTLTCRLVARPSMNGRRTKYHAGCRYCQNRTRP